jgi:hypothetical protein
MQSTMLIKLAGDRINVVSDFQGHSRTPLSPLANSHFMLPPGIAGCAALHSPAAAGRGAQVLHARF